MMIILALDLGNNKSVGCFYDTKTPKRRVEKDAATASCFGDSISRANADRVVVEVGPTVGWITDLVKGMNIDLPLVETPCRSVREWRSLIQYRQRPVTRGTAVRNTIRTILDRVGHGVVLRSWGRAEIKALENLAHPVEETAEEDSHRRGRPKRTTRTSGAGISAWA